MSDHSGMKLEIKSRRKAEKFTEMWKLNNTLLNNQWVKEVIKNILENIYISKYISKIYLKNKL